MAPGAVPGPWHVQSEDNGTVMTDELRTTDVHGRLLSEYDPCF